MEHEQQWAGINIQWDGKEIAIKYSDMTVEQLTNLLYGALLEIPWCREAMEIAIEKTKPNEMDRSTFIHNLRLLRINENLNTIELADRLNLPYNRISLIENNPKIKIAPEEIEIIANYFKLTPETLTNIRGSVTFKTQNDGKEEEQPEAY